jgi:two-component system response regulator DevR
MCSRRDMQHNTAMNAIAINAATALRIFVVEDSAVVREMPLSPLQAIPGDEVIGYAGSAPDAIDALIPVRPDVVLTDFGLESGTALDVLAAIRANSLPTTVIVLTNQASDAYRSACMDAGADYFLDKSYQFPQLASIVEGLEFSRHAQTENCNADTSETAPSGP